MRKTADIHYDNRYLGRWTMKKLYGIALVLASVAASGFAQDADKLARLDHYVGSWGGYSGRTTSISGSIDITSAWVKVGVKKTTSDAIELEGSLWGAKAALRFDNTSAKYLLSWSVDGFPPVVDLAVQFAEPAGFVGAATFTCKGKECEAKATIKEGKDGGSEWELVVTQGKNKWRLSLGLGKGQ